MVAHSAQAQQSAKPKHIAVLLVVFSLEGKEATQFRQGLREAGYVEGRDVVIEWRSANADYRRVANLVAGLVEHKPDVIVLDGTAAAQAAKRATSTIPIVMAAVADPLGSGLVADLARPGGNITGFSLMSPELLTKRLQLLKETIPGLMRVAVLWNPNTPWQPNTAERLKAVAPSLSIHLNFVSVRTPEELESAFSAVARAHPQAVYLLSDAQLFVHRKTIVKLASSLGLPAIYSETKFCDEGGLMSYAADSTDHYHRAAEYVDKILKGAKPGDLPVEQPTKFEFVINLKTATALGLAIPKSVLLQADRVIQ
jgi:putative ABC transport system substrate-binding protein